jgi:hypothetical protein
MGACKRFFFPQLDAMKAAFGGIGVVRNKVEW